MKDMLRDYSIELTESDDFDYAFLGADDILDKSIGLQESIEYGLKNIDKYARGGDCFIFDGSDSTSLMGSYEVLEQSDAKFLFKNQTLKNRFKLKNYIQLGTMLMVLIGMMGIHQCILLNDS